MNVIGTIKMAGYCSLSVKKILHAAFDIFHHIHPSANVGHAPILAENMEDCNRKAPALTKNASVQALMMRLCYSRSDFQRSCSQNHSSGYV